MADSPLVQQLLDELLESRSTPEEVCRSYPDLLPRIRERWQQICQLRAQLSDMFPSFSKPGVDAMVTSDKCGTLPQIAGYEVESLLGRGGMGVVFRARHLSLKRVVALKMAISGAYSSPSEQERFQREAEAVARLQHQNVVQIYDVGNSDGRPYLTMELIEGGTLAQKLVGDPQPLRESVLLVSTLAGAVHAAHQSGIVHRDLKPANILLTADGTPKITDFGLSRRLDDEAGLTFTGTALGTPTYMAPEQVSGKHMAVDVAVDIYALGVILYELLTCQLPFRGKTVAETLLQVTSRDPVPPSRLNARIPRDLETICLKCMNKEPRRRYVTAEKLALDLASFLRGEAIMARPESRPERLARWVRRRPLLSGWLLAAIFLTFAVLGFGVWLLFEHAATTRRIGAERAAAERMVDEHLLEMTKAMRSASWDKARTALERAKAWLGPLGSDDLKSRVVQGDRDLELVARLGTIRLTGYTQIGAVLDFTRADEEYETEFCRAGLGNVDDHPGEVAARIQASDICNALLAALDHWSVCATDARRRRWVADVAERVDGTSATWRTRARDPAVWKNNAALLDLVTSAPVPEQSVALLLAVEFIGGGEFNNHLEFLERVHDRHPNDFWVNMRLAAFMTTAGKNAEAIGYYQAAATLRPDVPLIHHNLGMLLAQTNRYGQALARLREAIRLDPTFAVSHRGYSQILTATHRYTEAIQEAQLAIQLGDNSSIIRTTLGKSLEALNRSTEALDEHRLAVKIDPKNRVAQKEYCASLLRLRRLDELLTAWAATFCTDPPRHEDCYGYAELCLFLGREEEYLRARRFLLTQFGETADPFIAERTARACLLGPAVGNELNQAVALSTRAAAVDQSRYQIFYPAFVFVKGLAEYRQGRYDLAISSMRGDASRVLGPTPRIVLAMAQFRSGQVEDARKSLAVAISTHDWRPDSIHDQDDWIRHSLRREAERLILPDLPALLDGTLQPHDNEERLAMLGSYLFANRFRDAARLYKQIFAADPNLVRDLASVHRYRAACVAALAGCGHGMNVEKLNEPEREEWRAQARRWLGEELAACREALERDPLNHHVEVRLMLNRLRETTDLAGLREPKEFEKLPPDERKDCLALWEEAETLVKRNNETQ